MKYWFILIISIFITKTVSTQNWEAGMFVGATNYRGDLAPFMVLSETKPAVGVFVKNNINEFFSINNKFSYGSIEGDDKNFYHLSNRGLSFSSTLIELSSILEFNFFPFVKGLNRKSFTPFVYTGVAIFHFTPFTEFKNKKYNLTKLHTEGQGIQGSSKDPYSTYNFALPIGGGFKFALTDKMYIALDIGYRVAFTDYLDDVSATYFNKNKLYNKAGEKASILADRSTNNRGLLYGKSGKQRGNPQTLDWYIFGGVTISYLFSNSRCYEF